MKGANDISIWQNKILPFSIVLLSALVILFITLYVIEIKHTQDSFLTSDNYSFSTISKEINKPDLSQFDKLYNAEILSMLNRHYNSSIIIKTRILTLNLSFLTGMILCFMGAIFILGKFSENTSTASITSGNFTGSLVSSSPGIILSALGVCLIAISIFSKTELEVRDSASYVPLLDNRIIPGESGLKDDTSHLNNINLLNNTTLPK
jgi:hypothetical protein